MEAPQQVSPAQDRVSAKPQREAVIRRGRSLDRLRNCWARVDREVEGEDEPSLTQIMAAIQGCQNKLIDHFEGLRMEFSFMKHDILKLREKAQATACHVASLEDTVRPLDTVTQVTKRHCLNIL